jgi:predicted GIY-YIG superfamily endonuclease
MIGYIYSLHGKTESDIFYIGATINPKQRQYAHRVSFPYYKYDCYITLSIIEEVDNDRFWELKLLEAYWIQQFRAWGFKLINRELYYGFNLASRIKYIEIINENQ